jgi:hypothetical protein
MSTILVLIASALVALCALPDAHASAIISRPLYLGLDQGLVGYWSFEGKTVSGTRIFDASGTGNHGTMTNGPTLVNGKLGQAMQFDGSDDYLDAGDNSTLHMDQGKSMTFSVWLRIPKVPPTDSKSIFRYDDCDSADGDNTCSRNLYALTLNVSGDLVFFYGPSSGLSSIGTSNILKPLTRVLSKSR